MGPRLAATVAFRSMGGSSGGGRRESSSRSFPATYQRTAAPTPRCYPLPLAGAPVRLARQPDLHRTWRHSEPWPSAYAAAPPDPASGRACSARAAPRRGSIASLVDAVTVDVADRRGGGSRSRARGADRRCRTRSRVEASRRRASEVGARRSAVARVRPGSIAVRAARRSTPTSPATSGGIVTDRRFADRAAHRAVGRHPGRPESARSDRLTRTGPSRSAALPSAHAKHATPRRRATRGALPATARSPATRCPDAAAQSLDEFVGQEHLVGERGPLRRAVVARGHLASLVLWGPPGTGKTSLARLLAGEIGAQFATMSAVMAGVADVRGAIARGAGPARAERDRARSSSSTRSIDSTRPSRTPSCPTSRTARSPSSARRPRTRTSR